MFNACVQVKLSIAKVMFHVQVSMMFHRTQVSQSLVEFVHEDGVVGGAEVRVGVATKLVVAVHHLANFAHQPLSLVKRAHFVSISVEDSNGCLFDLIDGDVCRDSSSLATAGVLFGKLLESPFNAILEEVLEGFGGEGVLRPDNLLIAPHFAQMSADVLLEVLPVVTDSSRKSNHFHLLLDLAVVMVAHGATHDVHLHTGS